MKRKLLPTLITMVLFGSGCGTRTIVKTVNVGTGTIASTTPDSGVTGTNDSSTTSEPSLRRSIGETGEVEGLAFKVTYLKRALGLPTTEFGDPIRVPSGAILVAAGVTFKNDTHLPVDPFCGQRSATLVDAEGDNFQPAENQIDVEGNHICGQDVQPGFKDSETLAFVVPASVDIETSSLALWNGDRDANGNTYVSFSH